MIQTVRDLLPFFEYEHLPPHLQEISKPLCELARSMAENASIGTKPEGGEALRKLLEAKDCAVRAFLQPGGS